MPLVTLTQVKLGKSVRDGNLIKYYWECWWWWIGDDDKYFEELYYKMKEEGKSRDSWSTKTNKTKNHLLGMESWWKTINLL